MRKAFYIGILSIAAAAALLLAACDKEKLVESTEYVHDIEYVELPADTIYRVDTVFSNDSVTIEQVDTVVMSDTIVQVDYVYDTVVITDTLEVTVTDTLETLQCNPNEYFAVAALHYYCDPLVIQFINQEFGLNDGWIFYLSTFQLGLTKQSSNVYDIHGYIDYWTPDWSGFYPLEFYWRMTFTGGDAADVDNWQLDSPPAAVSNYQPGFKLVQDDPRADR